MKTAITLLLLPGFTMLLLACTQEAPDETRDSVTPAPISSAQSDTSDDARLVFSSLELDQTNRGTININGYDRHFSVTFPTSYNNDLAYPVALFLHGCMCRPDFTDEAILNYLHWAPRLESYKEDFITIKMSAFSEKKPEVPQVVEDGGARGMWFWHEGLESERDDYALASSRERRNQPSGETQTDLRGL